MLSWGCLDLRLICVLLRAVKDNSLVGVALALGDLAAALGSSFGLMVRLPIASLCLSLRLFWLMWQELCRMYPLLADCAEKAAFLATFARNACFSR